MENQDYILCECELEPLEAFVASIEDFFEIKIAKAPSRLHDHGTGRRLG